MAKYSTYYSCRSRKWASYKITGYGAAGSGGGKGRIISLSP
jgi:hypothetical protein